MLDGPDVFMVCGRLRVDFFSTHEMLLVTVKCCVGIIRARPKFLMINDNTKMVIDGCTIFVFLSLLIFSRKELTYLQKLPCSTTI